MPFLLGGGELGALIRGFDWRSTPLGPPEGWPQSLKTAVRIMLTSRQPIWIGWGEQLIYLYNDPYRSIVGGKHPAALGQPASVVWREIWDDISPLLSTAMNGDEGTYVEEQLLIMERNGYPEETYYTFSYSPIPEDGDGGGGAGGIICANTDDTRRVIGERQVALLRELAAGTADARSWQDACERSARALATNPRDILFALIYVADPDGRSFSLAGSTPDSVPLDGSLWPVEEVLRTHEPRVVPLSGPGLPTGAWRQPSSQAAALPIAAAGETGRPGVLVVGLNPFRLFDDDYQGFLSLAAGQISAGIGNARAWEEERKRAETLAELDRAKTAFFSNVSHEFRTPLTLMLGPVEELLAKDEVPADERDLLALVQRNGLRLQRLVNMLLDFSRMEAGRVRASYQPADLAAFTAELASSFRSACEKAGLELKVGCPPLPEPVYVDRDMWEKIVLNLVSNAFKFTLDGGIEVSLRSVDGHAELTVRDTGAGIPPQEMPKLFERFHRVEGTPGRTQEGSGIGLALVQELARLHGGSVRAESELGKGTAFSVTLPFGKDHLPADRIGAASGAAPLGAAPFVEEALRWISGGEEERQPLPAGPRPRILLADDNSDMRGYIRRLLSPQYEVTAVADGLAALRSAREAPPDLVLTDVMMPGLDGFGLLQELRAAPETRGLPILMLSARAGEESKVEGLGAGADDYLVKPFGARELLARVGAHLQMARLRRETAEALVASHAEASRRKDEFLATLAHELRNPLAPIRNMLEIMKRSGGDRGLLAQAQATMERQVSHMVRLIDDLLDVGRISQGKLELKRERVDLSSIVSQAVEACRPLAEYAGHQIRIDLPAEPIHLDADPVRLAQVFGNILNNSCKYTDPGGEIRLTAERQDGEVVVTVRDNGIGIPADELSGIFEIFKQVDRAMERSQGGLGIGLTLARRLVEMHGGTVRAHSEGPGRGSELVVRLPALAEPPKEPAREPDVLPATAGRRILVVDDNRDAAETLTMLLEMAGHEVRTAYDGLEALDAAAEHRPEVVLMDIGMPRLNGYEAAGRLREQEWGKSVFLVAITGWGQEDDRRRTSEAGFDAHLVKPIEYPM
ncbi:MAG TPA: ATP-binding protein, partial [Thermoanaerobaculia bacterium]|nr:ATP-binding protein [Thermoanaerobaculia bacterium]